MQFLRLPCLELLSLHHREDGRMRFLRSLPVLALLCLAAVSVFSIETVRANEAVTIASGATATLSISSVDSSGSLLGGFYVDSVVDVTTNTVLMSGTYTPRSLSVPVGDTISATLDDYGSYYVVGSSVG